MKAYAITSYTQAADMAWIDAPVPHVKDNEVLVRVTATGVNPLDRMIAQGTFAQLLSYRFPQILGNEFAGIVEAVGPGTTQYAVGDRVFGRPDILSIGTFAPYIAVDQDDLSPTPSNLSDTEAASLPLVLLTSIQAMTEKTHITPGDKVFIQGGAGGLGSIAIQVAKHLGATVATTVSTKNIEVVRRLGADVIVDYTTQKYEDAVKDYDLVLDTLGGSETLRSMNVLRPGGTLVSVAGTPEPSFAKQLRKPWLAPIMWMMSRKIRHAARQRGITYSFLFMRANGHQLRAFLPAVESGQIHPVIGHVFPFDDIDKAIATQASGSSQPGKIVVTVDAS
ncbi:NADP-dependent oxidoreductase [Schaalia sp. ZJ1691]|uniref:NADP-dependent oxidoreductase n=1 Tax=Schaalia sp. ZJ1691 TaxID=2709404 RepID=UPI00197D2A36|nr:NADP-dependent oxidoreductase [Schaalia sp. ZJ1691]